MLRALTTFHALGRTVSKDDLLDPKDPIVKGRESLFEEAQVTNVEQATANPGEKRTTTLKAPAKKATRRRG